MLIIRGVVEQVVVGLKQTAVGRFFLKTLYELFEYCSRNLKELFKQTAVGRFFLEILYELLAYCSRKPKQIKDWLKKNITEEIIFLLVFCIFSLVTVLIFVNSLYSNYGKIEPIINVLSTYIETCTLFIVSFVSLEGFTINFGFGFFLIFSGIIFSVGAFGIAFNRKNILLLMVSVEIMFLGINLIFISAYVFLNLEVGLIYALISLSISAAEAAVGFSLVMSSFRNSPDITIKGFNRLRG